MELKTAKELCTLMPHYEERKAQEEIHKEYVKQQLIETLENAAQDGRTFINFVFPRGWAEYSYWETELKKKGYKIESGLMLHNAFDGSYGIQAKIAWM